MRKSIKCLLMSSLFMLFLLPIMVAQPVALVQYHHVDADKSSGLELSSAFPALDKFEEYSKIILKMLQNHPVTGSHWMIVIE